MRSSSNGGAEIDPEGDASMGMLDGKVALVLGAGSYGNMGQAIAARFAAEGARVMCAGRDVPELLRFSRTMGFACRRCDITNEAELHELAAETVGTLGKLDVAVNATGLNQVGPF